MSKLILLTLLCAAMLVSAEAEVLSVGQSISSGSLVSADGNNVDLQEELKETPLVLIFYRGGWCPYCNTHLADLQTIEPELQKLGYKIIAISPDKPSELVNSSAKNDLAYMLLSDSSMATAKAFGLAFTVDEATLVKYKGYGIDLEAASGEKHHMLPEPAVFIIGTDGIIDYAHSDENYRERLSSDAVLAAAKEALK